MSKDSDTTADAEQETKGSQNNSWYPYITKVQFEKFLSRLQTRIPEQIDRDYIRAIIRTPSMIHRFLRGIEAMGLIDNDQKPTQRLEQLVGLDTRQQTAGAILQDLYPDLIEIWRQSSSAMADADIVEFFHKRTGMGKDSANKMRMFFKYLVESADVEAAADTSGDPDDNIETATAKVEANISRGAAVSKPDQEAVAENTNEKQIEVVPDKVGATDDGQVTATKDSDKPESNDEDRPQSSRRGSRERGDRPDRSERSDRSDRPTPSRNGPQTQNEKGTPSNRALTELQTAFIETVQNVVNIKIDGDWDDDMIRTAFDRLERLFDRIRRS